MKLTREDWTRTALGSLLGIAVTALVFAALVSVLVAAAWLQLKLNDPLASPALTTLYDRLRTDPEDEKLKEEIRAVDLLARRAYFSNRTQVTSGGILILAGAATGAIALALREIIKKKIPVSPQGRPAPRPGPARLLVRRIMAAAGAVLLAGALLIAFIILPVEAGLVTSGETAVAPTDGAGAGKAENSAAAAAAWPGLRGPGGLALAGAGEWPLSWDGRSGQGILWQRPLKLPGHNSPVVAGGIVFLSGANKKEAKIQGWDAAGGELLFTATITFGPATAQLKLDAENVGYAAPTMAADDTHLAALFAGGELVCLDHSGQVLWRQDLGAPDLNYGFASSPLLWNGTLYIQYDHNGGARVIALDPATGELRWEKKRDVYSSWASPIAVVARGRTAIVLSANPYATAYDAASGDELWSVELLSGEIGASPSYADGMVFIGNDPGLMAGLKADDGTTVWEYYDDVPNVASPVVVSGLLFMASSAGAVTCLDAKTGNLVWRQGFTDGFYASPAAAGGNVYLTDREGVTHIVGVNRTYVQSSAGALGEPVNATPAFADSRIYIRGTKNLYCIGK